MFEGVSPAVSSLHEVDDLPELRDAILGALLGLCSHHVAFRRRPVETSFTVSSVIYNIIKYNQYIYIYIYYIYSFIILPDSNSPMIKKPRPPQGGGTPLFFASRGALR
jgi:hypothetical protein